MVSASSPLHSRTLAKIQTRSSRPIISQIERALWSSSIILSTSTVRKTSWERSIEERRGRGEPEGTLTFVVIAALQFPKKPLAVVNFFTPSLARLSPHGIEESAGLRPGLLSVVPDGTGFWAEIEYPGLRPGLLSVVLAGLFLG